MTESKQPGECRHPREPTTIIHRIRLSPQSVILFPLSDASSSRSPSPLNKTSYGSAPDCSSDHCPYESIILPSRVQASIIKVVGPTPTPPTGGSPFFGVGPRNLGTDPNDGTSTDSPTPTGTTSYSDLFPTASSSSSSDGNNKSSPNVYYLVVRSYSLIRRTKAELR